MTILNKIFTLLLVLSIPSFATALPDFIYQKSEITPESNYKIYQNMQKLKRYIRQHNKDSALEIAINTLKLSSQIDEDRVIDQYDYLFTHYIILSIIESDEKEDQEYIRLSTKLFNYLDDVTSKGVWEESELGQFQMKIYREVGNATALKLLKHHKTEQMEDLDKALKIIEKSEKYIKSSDDFYIKNTKARILEMIEKEKVIYEIIN